MPRASAAADKSRAFPGVSVACMNPEHCRLRFIARVILNSVALMVVMRISSIPCSYMATASPTLAVHIPTDPFSICSRASAGHLWVLA